MYKTHYMKNLKSFLLAFAFLLFSFQQTKAQDDCKDCGIVINDVKVDSIIYWNFKTVDLVFPIKTEWKKYDLITIGIIKYNVSKSNPNTFDEKGYRFLCFTSQEFIDNFAKGTLGVVRIPYESYPKVQLTKNPNFPKDLDWFWKNPTDNAGTSTVWGTYYRSDKSEPAIKRDGSIVIQITGRMIAGKKFEREGSTEVVATYGEPTVLWRSNPVPFASHGTKDYMGEKWADKSSENYFTGTGSNTGKPSSLKKEAVNYSDKYFIIKK